MRQPVACSLPFAILEARISFQVRRLRTCTTGTQGDVIVLVTISFLPEARCVCRLMLSHALPLDGLARCRQDPISRGHAAQNNKPVLREPGKANSGGAPEDGREDPSAVDHGLCCREHMFSLQARPAGWLNVCHHHSTVHCADRE